MAKRLREIRKALGDPDRAEMAKTLKVSVSTLAYYERGESEPTVSVLAIYRTSYGVNLDWLVTGKGPIFWGGDVGVANTTLADIRKYTWNIAETFWSKVPRRTKPDAFADQFLEMFDYFLSREDVKGDVASEVIQFEAERLKRASEKAD